MFIYNVEWKEEHNPAKRKANAMEIESALRGGKYLSDALRPRPIRVALENEEQKRIVSGKNMRLEEIATFK